MLNHGWYACMIDDMATHCSIPSITVPSKDYSLFFISELELANRHLEIPQQRRQPILVQLGASEERSCTDGDQV